MAISRILGLALLSTALFACDDDPVEPDPDVATAVITNVAFGTADVDVLVSGIVNPVTLDLDFAEFTSACVALPAGQPITLTFRTGATILATEQVTLQEGEEYTILLANDATGADAIVLQDDVTIPAGQRAVRFVNVIDDPVDAYAFELGTAMGNPDVANLAYIGDVATLPDYMLIDADHGVVRFFDAGQTANPLAEEVLPTATVAPAATVILTETATGFEAFALGPCS